MQERDVIPQHKTLVLVVLSVVALITSAVIAQVVLAWRLSELRGRDREHERRTTSRELAGIEQTPAIDDGAAPVYAAQRQELGSYGWVDRAQGLVRVPIDKAIHDYVEQERR